MKLKNKSPGSDGITAEVITVGGEYLEDFVIHDPESGMGRENNTRGMDEIHHYHDSEKREN